MEDEGLDKDSFELPEDAVTSFPLCVSNVIYYEILCLESPADVLANSVGRAGVCPLFMLPC